MGKLTARARVESSRSDDMAMAIIRLLESSAGRRQWERARERRRAHGGAYLWDVTVARFIAATHVKSYHVFESASPAEQFLEEFVQAVASRRYASARTLWEGMNEFAGSSTQSAASRPLMRRLRELAPAIDPAVVASRVAADEPTFDSSAHRRRGHDQ
ncbi:hypothetical protein [Microbacterium paraoxydans]|uniref:hypothetical protein n=1 Tax=Microbacterium paraoxydans TaxID=199592 RepID=UPI003D70D9D0